MIEDQAYSGGTWGTNPRPAGAAGAAWPRSAQGVEAAGDGVKDLGGHEVGAREGRSVQHTLDVRDPLVVDLHDLDRRAGTMKSVHRTAPAPADLGVDMIGVPEGSDLLLDLRLEAVGEGVLVSGTVEVDLTGQCTRCLDPLSDHRTYDLQELYFYPGRDAEEDALRIQDDLVDLDPAVRAAVVL